MPCQINNNSDFDVTEIEDLIQDLFSFSQKRFGFHESPTLNLMSDKSNSSPLGKTAYYDPNNMEITIYVDGRHPKDIMRSFSHELVHHNQNLKGEFANIVGQGESNYAQTNPHLRKMEKEAYLKGNMCFRDWEDGYKSSNPNILNERRIYKMSIKDWKNKELSTLLNEKWGFSMNLNKLNEAKGGKKPDFPDVDGDGDRKEPISKAQKDKKAKGGNDKPKKKAKKGEQPAHLKKYQDKQKAKKGKSEKKEEINEISMRGPHQQGGNEESDAAVAKKIKDGAKNIPSSPEELKKKNNNNNTKTMKEGVKDMSKEEMHSFLEMLATMGKIKESEIAEIADKLHKKYNKEEDEKKKMNEQEETQTPTQQDTKLKTTSGGRYSAKDKKMVANVKNLANRIIKNPSQALSDGGVETIIQDMIKILGSSADTISQTKTDLNTAKGRK